jgi:hypothetical protein
VRPLVKIQIELKYVRAADMAFAGKLETKIMKEVGYLRCGERGVDDKLEIPLFPRVCCCRLHETLRHELLSLLSGGDT